MHDVLITSALSSAWTKVLLMAVQSICFLEFSSFFLVFNLSIFRGKGVLLLLLLVVVVVLVLVVLVVVVVVLVVVVVEGDLRSFSPNCPTSQMKIDQAPDCEFYLAGRTELTVLCCFVLFYLSFFLS